MNAAFSSISFLLSVSLQEEISLYSLALLFISFFFSSLSFHSPVNSLSAPIFVILLNTIKK